MNCIFVWFFIWVLHQYTFAISWNSIIWVLYENRVERKLYQSRKGVFGNANWWMILMPTQSSIIVIRAEYLISMSMIQKNKIQCCSGLMSVLVCWWGVEKWLWKLLMSQEQDSMLFCLTLVWDCGQVCSEKMRMLVMFVLSNVGVVVGMLGNGNC